LMHMQTRHKSRHRHQAAVELLMDCHFMDVHARIDK